MSEIRKETVCGVVVTFNRKELLKDCLKALIEQTRPLDAILIVDNASTDNTQQALLEWGYIQELPPEKIWEPYEAEFVTKIKNVKNENVKVIYVRMHENTGGAGGFHVGQKCAFEQGYEWIWLMDDDGFPVEDCLSKLLEKNVRKNLKASNPLVIDKENCDVLSFGLSKDLMTVQSAINASIDEIILNKANPFNGTLIHYDLIKDAGFIKKEMFIWGDETEYFKRLSSIGYEFATVTTALFYHPASKTIYSEKLFGLFKMAKKPEKLEMNFYRNQGYLNMKYGSIFSHRIAAKNFIFFLLDGEFKKAFLSLAYYKDGMLNKYKLKNLR
ncbi:TPA: glycosyltransferase [Vibrio cholerae]